VFAGIVLVHRVLDVRHIDAYIIALQKLFYEPGLPDFSIIFAFLESFYREGKLGCT
jgi:hypothetical protein